MHVGAGICYQPPRRGPARARDGLRDGGVGGNYAFADPATGIAFALTKNRLTADFSAAEAVAGIVIQAASDC